MSRVQLGPGMGLAGWCKVGGGSWDVQGCPMATWDNLDLGLAG